MSNEDEKEREKKFKEKNTQFNNLELPLDPADMEYLKELDVLVRISNQLAKIINDYEAGLKK